MFVFFFQAEDGIRDLTVTGVQTCALPISGGIQKRTGPASPKMGVMPSITALATALPPHVVRQEEAVEVARRVYAGKEDLLKLLRVFTRSGVEQRHTAFPPEYYLRERSFEERNRDFVEQGVALAEKAARA